MNSPDSTVVVPLDKTEQIKARIADLRDSLRAQLPNYESLLHTIHRNLATDPDTVHLLTDEEIGIIVAALSKRTGIFIAKEVAEKKSGSKGKKADLSDLM